MVGTWRNHACKTEEKRTTPDMSPQYQALYERYLATFLGLASKVDPEAEYPELQLLGAFEGIAPYIAYIDIITDVIADAYMKQLKLLSVEGILPIMGMLDECAQQKAENELFALNEETLIAISHEHFLTSDLVEEIIEQLGDDSVFKKRPFLFYYALAIMQLSLILGDKQDDTPDEQRITRFIDIRVCLERARFTLGAFSQRKNTAHKDVASKGERADRATILKIRVSAWGIRLKVSPRIIRVQHMSRKWGSCSTTGIITLAFDLYEQDNRFQDFVIVHELLHLRIPNHGRLFKALMTSHVPGWRKLEIQKNNRAHAKKLAQAA